MLNTVLTVDRENPARRVLDEAAKCISRGGILVYPTETLYGIGADATNRDAVRRVLAAKRRPDDKPILVIVHSTELLKRLVTEVPKAAEILMREFWPGPLTIVFKAAECAPAELTGSSKTIGIRIPSSKFCLELLSRCNCPLTSTSANVSGGQIRNTVADIRAELSDAVDMYIDAGVLPESRPSTVISVVHRKVELIREGTISFEHIQAIVADAER